MDWRGKSESETHQESVAIIQGKREAWERAGQCWIPELLRRQANRTGGRRGVDSRETCKAPPHGGCERQKGRNVTRAWCREKEKDLGGEEVWERERTSGCRAEEVRVNRRRGVSAFPVRSGLVRELLQCPALCIWVCGQVRADG